MTCDPCTCGPAKCEDCDSELVLVAYLTTRQNEPRFALVCPRCDMIDPSDVIRKDEPVEDGS